VQDALAASVPFPSRLGTPEDYAKLVQHIVDERDAQRRGDPAGRGDPPGAALIISHGCPTCRGRRMGPQASMSR
jgi:hypothetical protein